MTIKQSPEEFVDAHSGAVVENHLNMVRTSGKPKLSASVVAALLNSHVVDHLFLCISGSIAVSAFELEALPLAASENARTLAKLVASGASSDLIEAECARLYGEHL